METVKKTEDWTLRMQGLNSKKKKRKRKKKEEKRGKGDEIERTEF